MARAISTRGSSISWEWRKACRSSIWDANNPLRFDSPGALYEYWSSHNLSEEAIIGAFRDTAARHFETSAVFEAVKHVTGLRAVT